jgi:hypothetical protein
VLGHEIHGGQRLRQQVGMQTVFRLAAGMATSNPTTVQLVAAAVEPSKWMQEDSKGQRPSEWRSTHPPKLLGSSSWNAGCRRP